jgi:hypothetical protein
MRVPGRSLPRYQRSGQVPVIAAGTVPILTVMRVLGGSACVEGTRFPIVCAQNTLCLG